jgi:hypothetical protein
MITYEREMSHYIIYLNGEFYCTADDMDEVKREIENIKKEQENGNKN